MPVSPTQFPQLRSQTRPSAIGVSRPAATHASTSIASHDYTFPAALLKAAGQVVSEMRPVLLTVSDCPLPAPLDAKRPVAAPFALSLVLAPQVSDRARFRIRFEVAQGWRGGRPSRLTGFSGSRRSLARKPGRARAAPTGSLRDRQACRALSAVPRNPAASIWRYRRARAVSDQMEPL